ncbi:MAG: hypothetical protein K2G55_08015 [Lachnospiraceae bacterium]|nr:hypothetical protein [Lachnospiraceae bacterium]MDE7202361.1 hypothetical protein [Lachnospiraceae bacterium]
MNVYAGEFVISHGVILDRLFINENEVIGCMIFMPEEKEYFIDKKGFELIKNKTGLRIETDGEYIQCVYADINEPEIFERAEENNPFEKFPETIANEDEWIKEYIRLNKLDKLNRKQTTKIVNKAVSSK